jgi:hypothetical protein
MFDGIEVALPLVKRSIYNGVNTDSQIVIILTLHLIVVPIPFKQNH